ncbi:TetR/AcrR family transcriptional regulator [Rhodococcus sp. Eu-32]|uniref:TetR/AcrR family transcriptional regulator n=1 Tax=Rhodococcus sp. Eu-32 TaxID=1017319 RepID=UPI000F7ADEC8|nr:TetR family transcriptional regulator [Rhodococcus sp. Eu-32]RRQ25294.1 TetR/AcrR family transcriptional regulator [Rhodococcus sp. Eu-32]
MSTVDDAPPRSTTGMNEEVIPRIDDDTGDSTWQRPDTARSFTAVPDACARIVLSRGISAVTVGDIEEVTGITRARLYRRYRDRADLLAQLYREGHRRAARWCADPAHHQRESGPARVREFAHAVLEDAATDPVARALHSLEMSPIAHRTGLDSIYALWGAFVTSALSTPAAALEDRAHAADIAALVVGAVAGLCVAADPLTHPGQAGHDHAARVLHAVLPQPPQ